MKPNKQQLAVEKAKQRQARTQRQIVLLEKYIPISRRITQHPRFKKWVPVVFATAEVMLPLLLIPIIIGLLSLIPRPDLNVPTPNINLPKPPLPSINIDLPSIPFPDLPGWLDTILYWIRKTIPIWIAVGFVIYETRKHNKQQKTDQKKKSDTKASDT